MLVIKLDKMIDVTINGKFQFDIFYNYVKIFYNPENIPICDYGTSKWLLASRLLDYCFNPATVVKNGIYCYPTNLVRNESAMSDKFMEIIHTDFWSNVVFTFPHQKVVLRFFNTERDFKENMTDNFNFIDYAKEIYTPESKPNKDNKFQTKIQETDSVIIPRISMQAVMVHEKFTRIKKLAEVANCSLIFAQQIVEFLAQITLSFLTRDGASDMNIHGCYRAEFDAFIFTQIKEK